MENKLKKEKDKKNIGLAVGGVLVGAGLTAAAINLARSDKGKRLKKKIERKVENVKQMAEDKTEKIKSEAKDKVKEMKKKIKNA